MKAKNFPPLITACHIGMMTLLLLQGCDKGTGQLFVFGSLGSGGAENNRIVKQLDISVFIPVHPSSLEYFDYCVSYTDNTGEEVLDTIRKSNGGADVGYATADIFSNVRVNSTVPHDVFWMTSFAYKSLPVVCRCEVWLKPKVSRDSEVSFSFIVPKPRIYSRVIYSSHSSSGSVEDSYNDEPDILEFDNARIGTFLHNYGSVHTTLSVSEDYDGINCLYERD